MREDLKFLIVGDTIIDEDIFLIASGISLETPTMKTVYDTNRVKYGGAANVARRLADYDLDVTFLTSISEEHVNPISSTGAKFLIFIKVKIILKPDIGYLMETQRISIFKSIM